MRTHQYSLQVVTARTYLCVTVVLTTYGPAGDLLSRHQVVREVFTGPGRVDEARACARRCSDAMVTHQLALRS